MELEEFLYYKSFRPGQRELALSVYEACKRGERLVVEAVSGFGKTAAVLAGSLAAAKEDDLKILYACRTKRQIWRVMEEVSRLQDRNQLAAVDLSSKYDYCLLMRKSRFGVSSESFRWYCNFHVTNNLCSYFLNLTLLNNKVTSLAHQKSMRFFPHSTLLQKSEEIHACPYEVTRLALAGAKLVTTTYHYVFDEASRSLLFTSTQFEPSRTIVIFDEAHNLRDFIRGLFTVALSVTDLERAVNESKELYLESVQDALRTLKTRIEDFCSASKSWFVDKESFLNELCRGHDKTWLANLSFELSTSAGVAWYSISTERKLPHSILMVGKFLTAFLSSLTEENLFLTSWENSLSIINVDPAKFFVEGTRKFKTTILLSATVSPSELFLRSIGLPSSTRLHRAEQNLALQITTLLDLGVTTKFKLRSHEMYSKISSRIVAVASMRPGGIGVFAPSYTVLEALSPLIEKGLGSESLIVESKQLTNQEASELMKSFKERKDSVLLAVQGGRFSEGEDFPGDVMNVSIVVGLSLPPPSPTLFAEYSTFAKSDRNNSYLLVSLLPALRKAFQSAGRHIRTPNKKGLVFLLDSRFADQRIIDLMPSWLKRRLIQRDFSLTEIEDTVRDLNLNPSTSQIDSNDKR